MQSAKSGVSRVLGLLSIKTTCLRQAVRPCHVLTVTGPIDKILSVASETREELVKSFDHNNSMQLDAWSLSSKAELVYSMDLSGQERLPETDTTSVQSLPAMQSIVIPHQPEPVLLDWRSIPFGDRLFYQSAQMLDDQTYDLEISTLLTTSPARSQPFEFDVDPTSLMSAATYSRRGHST
jgi:hypothetical protein